MFLAVGLFFTLCLVSYHPQDPSWNSVSGAAHARNLIGFAGSYTSDLCFQMLGLGAFAIPLLLWILAWKWLRSEEIESGTVKLIGAGILFLGISALLSLGPVWWPWGGSFSAGGMLGILLADSLRSSFNVAGAMLLTVISLILSLYLISTFSMKIVGRWLAGPLNYVATMRARWNAWRVQRQQAAIERARQRAERIAEARFEEETRRAAAQEAEPEPRIPIQESQQPIPVQDAPPASEMDIPIHALEIESLPQQLAPMAAELSLAAAAASSAEPRRQRVVTPAAPEMTEHPEYRLPATDLLNEIPGRSAYDSVELKEIAARIKAKFEEFNVHGAVVQINPGPVVTTFEFKPEAGIKYSRITTLTEDLCLGLQAESILIERIPGKPTIGIEVPNSRRELISLRQILESEEFTASHSHMTMCLGKDISGRIKVAALESMPHLLIAGSTGAGKSVMLNSMIMSILYKATPEEVRMILVDPKRLEMGLYEGIPHLLTPVITDAKKATNALRNAVLEMERRLKLLAAQGVRNIDQYNRKVRQLMNQPRSLFDEEAEQDDLRPLPYILILIDELADLMMVERGNVEEAVTRLAQ
ncbi:MAG: DNA translocase FtsK 4TM domain-containing protein, partial [Bryobacteraceae bacterium]